MKKLTHLILDGIGGGVNLQQMLIFWGVNYSFKMKPYSIFPFIKAKTEQCKRSSLLTLESLTLDQSI